MFWAAKEGNPVYDLPRTNIEGLDFSFSGIKTAVINLHHKDPNINKADLCASFQQAVTDMLITNSIKALDETQCKKFVIAGGVSRNSYIRKAFTELGQEKKIEIYYPEPILCTDNGAMIAAQGYYNYIKGDRADLNLNAVPNLKI